MVDIADFIARHASPYDPATDTYRRAPFAAPIKAGKNTAIYNAHSYHTKVPPQGIVPYIKHYTDPGDLVLDPFCGSGMTGVACLMTGRHSILNDLSPAAAHIAYNYCTPVDVEALKREFQRIKAAVREEFDWLYGTACDRCGGPATIQHTIWSDVFECGRCGAELVLWDVAVDHQTGKVRERFACPACHKEQGKRGVRWVRSLPVLTSYECLHCKPKRGDHQTSGSEERHIAEIEAASIPYWYPTTCFDESWEMWRGGHRDQGVTDVSRFYTRRNLWAMARLWHEVDQCGHARLASAVRFGLTAVSNYINKKQSFGGGGGGVSGTLYIPSFVMEKNVWLVVERKFEYLLQTLSSTGFQTASVVTVGSATHLPGLPDCALDYIFTDPPFGSNIFYADCNLIWEAWLNQGFTDQSQEAVVHVKHKDKNTLPEYARLMTDSFREMYRVLKPGRWASVVFHNSDDRIWRTILDAADAAGFELAEINSFDKEQLTFKGIRGAKGLERVTNKDIVLNLHKPRAPVMRVAEGNEASKAQPARGNGDTEIRVVECIAAYLAGHVAPEARTLQALWNTALGEMIRMDAVEISMEEVGAMLPHYFKEVDGRWYLRGEAVLGGNVFDLRTDAGAIAWLTAVLSEAKTTGDLIPEWQRLTAQSGGTAPGRLEGLLEENFWLDRRTGKWRLPTAGERESMSAQENLKDQAHLRVVRRFLAGQLPQRPGSRELAAWVQFCYSHQAYSEAVELFALVDASQIEEEWYRKLKRLVAVCQAKARVSWETTY